MTAFLSILAIVAGLAITLFALYVALLGALFLASAVVTPLLLMVKAYRQRQSHGLAA